MIKVGDIVCSRYRPVGSEAQGTVAKVSTGYYSVYVRWDDGENGWHSPEELRQIDAGAPAAHDDKKAGPSGSRNRP